MLLIVLWLHITSFLFAISLISPFFCLLLSSHNLYRYKKHSEAKDLSSKSLADKRAIFGAAMSYPSLSSSAKNKTSSNTSSEASDASNDVFSKIKGISAAETNGDESKKEKKSSKKAKKSKKD